MKGVALPWVPRLGYHPAHGPPTPNHPAKAPPGCHPAHGRQRRGRVQDDPAPVAAARRRFRQRGCGGLPGGHRTPGVLLLGPPPTARQTPTHGQGAWGSTPVQSPAVVTVGRQAQSPATERRGGAEIGRRSSVGPFWRLPQLFAPGEIEHTLGEVPVLGCFKRVDLLQSHRVKLGGHAELFDIHGDLKRIHFRG